MILIYIFSGENADTLFINDYIQFHFKICYLYYFKPEESKFNKFIDDFRNRIKPQEINIFKLDDIFKNSDDLLQIETNNKSKAMYQKSIMSIYHKEIETSSSGFNTNENLVDYFKFLLEYIKVNKDPVFRIEQNKLIIIDLSNCSQPLFSILYYLCLKNNKETEFQNFNVICWDKTLNNPFYLPIQFLESTSQIFLDLISEGNSTIKDLQQIYSQNRKLDKIVSQPFVSKYISQLLKQNLIKEEWLEGIKHFYLSEHGYIHISSVLNSKITKKSIEERFQYKMYSTQELIQKLIVSYLNKDFQMVDAHLEELLSREDISVTDILTIMDKLKDYHNEKLRDLLEKGRNLYPSSSEILSTLAYYHYEEKNYQMAFNLCKEAIQNDLNSALAWDLLGKLSLDEAIKM